MHNNNNNNNNNDFSFVFFFSDSIRKSYLLPCVVALTLKNLFWMNFFGGKKQITTRTNDKTCTLHSFLNLTSALPHPFSLFIDHSYVHCVTGICAWLPPHKNVKSFKIQWNATWNRMWQLTSYIPQLHEQCFRHLLAHIQLLVLNTNKLNLYGIIWSLETQPRMYVFIPPMLETRFKKCKLGTNFYSSVNQW